MKLMQWTNQKPDFACVFLTRHKYIDKYGYSLWRFEWIHGDPEEDLIGSERFAYYYLAWLTNDGDEWDEFTSCNYKEYFIIEKLPTMEEVHKR